MAAFFDGYKASGDVFGLIDYTDVNNRFGVTCYNGYGLYADGSVKYMSGNGTVTAAGYDWVTPTSNASLYEAKVTVTSGVIDSGTTGAWVALTTNRMWSISAGVGVDQLTTFTIEIRLAGGDGTILDSANISIEAISEP